MFDFLGAIAGGLFTAGTTVLGALQPIWQMMTSGFQSIYSALSTVGNFLWSTLKRIGAFLDHLWQDFFKGLFRDALHWMGKVFAFLHKYAALAFKYIHRVQQFLDRYYKQYIRPQLLMLQRMRQVLGVFRLLHIHTFDKLDKYLQHAESQLVGTFLQIRGYVNLVAGFVNDLGSPLGVLKLVLFGAAGPRQSAAVVRIFTGLPIGWFFPNYKKSAQPWEKPVFSSSQLLDPASNPPPSSLLSGVNIPDAPDSFTGASPIPDDAELDSGTPLYTYDDALGFLEQSELAVAADSGDQLSIIDMLATRQGFLADAGTAGAKAILSMITS